MFERREYNGRSRLRLSWPVTTALVLVNLAVYLFQFYLLPRIWPAFPFERSFALSLNGLQSGHVWQLLTFQFMHGGWLHIFANLWAVFVFGRVLEMTLGGGRMLGLYLVSGVIGGLFQILNFLALPGNFVDQAVVGASAGALGLIAAFAALFPRQELVLLLFFIIPLKMKARTLLWFSVGLALLGMFLPFGNIGHAAHLGGALTGFLGAALLAPPLRVRILAELHRQRSLRIASAEG